MPPPSSLKPSAAAASSASRTIVPPTQPASKGKQPLIEPTKVELTPAEKRKTWVNRIKLITDCCTALEEHKKWETEVHKCRALLNSRRIDMLDAVSKKRLEGEHIAAMERCNELNEEMDTTIQKLLELDNFWPVTTNSDTDGPPAEKLEALHRDVEELNKTMAAVKLQQDAQEVGPTSQTGTKRKRVDADAFEQVGNRIQDLEGRLTEQENYLYQAEENVLAGLSEGIDQKMEQFLASQASSSRRADEGKILVDVEAKWKVAESNVLVMRDEIEQMKRGTTLLEEKALEVPKINQELDANMAKLMERQQHTLAEIEQVRREQAALTVTLEACQTLMSQRAAAPQPPTADQIIDAVRGSIEARMQESITSTLLENRQEIERLLTEYNQALCNGVWGKLSSTSRMTETIYTWLQHYNKNPDGPS